MTTIFKGIFDFFCDDILNLKRYISPLDGKRVGKQQYSKENKYTQDVNTMFSTIEDCVFTPDSTSGDSYDKPIDDDYRYVELYNKIIEAGVQTIPDSELEWLKDYLKSNKEHWHDANFRILRRES